MSGFKLAPLSLIVGSLFVVNAVQAQDFTLDGSSADVTQNVTAEDKITSLNVSGGHTGTITGETITISGTGNVANVTTAGHPTATVSTLTIGTDQTKKVSITTDKDWALYNNGSSLTVLGEEIHLERTSADGANYGEAFRKRATARPRLAMKRRSSSPSRARATALRCCRTVARAKRTAA